MIGSILIGLDGSKYSRRATELCIRWSQRGNQVTLIGTGIVDEPTISHGELVPLGGSAFKEHRDEFLLKDATKQVGGFLDEFSEACKAAKVPHQMRTLNGNPEEVLFLAAQECDVLVLGQHTYFHFETDDEPCETLAHMLRRTVRPVVTVPDNLPGSDVVMIAYDATLQAARALQVFQAVGLDKIHKVHVVSVDQNKGLAHRNVELAGRFLSHQQIDHTLHPVVSDRSVADVLLEQADVMNAGLIVMGTYGNWQISEFLFGSVTQTMLANTKVPMFLYH
ncbi:MAG: universal stress protein [Gemmataceae bacterium]